MSSACFCFPNTEQDGVYRASSGESATSFAVNVPISTDTSKAAKATRPAPTKPSCVLLPAPIYRSSPIFTRRYCQRLHRVKEGPKPSAAWAKPSPAGPCCSCPAAGCRSHHGLRFGHYTSVVDATQTAAKPGSCCRSSSAPLPCCSSSASSASCQRRLTGDLPGFLSDDTFRSLAHMGIRRR